MKKNNSKKLTKYSKRVLEEIKATNEIAKYTSIYEAGVTFIAKIGIQISIRNNYIETARLRKILTKKHNIMLCYFKKMFEQFEKTYDYEKKPKVNNPAFKNKIWVCWWQGIDNAPEIVKACIKAVQKCVPENTVIIITEDNYKKYIEVPEWIEKKRRKGDISKTHFSDILRMMLLSEHGGMWLDSTTFCLNNDITKYMKLPIWSIKRPDYAHLSVARGGFANYALACDYDHRWVFAIIRDYLLHYWMNNSILIDYLFLDYIIVLVQEKDDRIKQLFSDIEPNNPNNDMLLNSLKDIYNKKKWQIIKQDTDMFKLTWKEEYPKQVGGMDTFYGKLLKGELS